MKKGEKYQFKCSQKELCTRCQGYELFYKIKLTEYMGKDVWKVNSLQTPEDWTWLFGEAIHKYYKKIAEA